MEGSFPPDALHILLEQLCPPQGLVLANRPCSICHEDRGLEPSSGLDIPGRTGASGIMRSLMSKNSAQGADRLENEAV